MTAFSAIDLSKLPAPDLIETVDFETVLQACRDYLAEVAPDLADSLLESDPASKVLEVLAYRELLLRQRINEAARGVLLAAAGGADLDQLGAWWGVSRLLLDAGDPEAVPPVAPTYESDDAFRSRIQLALEGYTSAGPIGAYTFHALSAHGQVKSVSVTSPVAGDVLVTVLGTEDDGTPSAVVLTAVEAALNDQDVRPLCDTVTVQAATIVNYTVTAVLTIGSGPDAATVLASAQAAVETYVAAQHKVGARVALSGLYQALHQPGVEFVTLTLPAADITPTATEAAYCTAITITQA